MRRIPIGLVLLGLVLVSSAMAKGRTETFKAPRDRVWTVALAFISQNYTVNTVSEADGVISFRGGTEEASILIVATSESETQVTVNSKAGHAGLSWGMGIDSKKVQSKVLGAITKGLAQADPSGHTQQATSAPPAASAAGGAASASVSAEGRGVFGIESTPPGAEVYVDGEFVGTTPIAEHSLTTGKHEIELRKKGFATWKRQLSVSPGAHATVAAEMEP
jgi:hypothetical protein